MKKPLNYIVIDDDSTNNLICSFIIKKFNKEANIHLFQEPEKALYELKNGLELNKDQTCSILFLDVNMPSMTGFEFLDEFRKLPEDTRKQFIIYMLTSSIEDFTEQANLYPFVAGFLSKPLKLDHLAEVSKKHATAFQH